MAKIERLHCREDAAKRIYRRFASQEHALALTRGQVWLPTFENVRDVDHGRQDAREGEYSWRPDVSAATTEEERTQAYVRGFANSGTGFGIVASKAYVDDASIEGSFNGFLLCASQRHNLTRMGSHCVRIQDPLSFMSAVTEALVTRFPGEWRRIFGRVVYERDFVGAFPLQHRALLGSPGNEAEEEIRLVWESVAHPTPEPILLNVPKAARYCSIF